MEQSAKQLTIKYAFLQSTYWISECIIYSFAAVYLHYKQFDNTQIGLVLALSAILSIILQPVIAAYADKSQKITLRSLTILLMFIALASALILYFAANSFLLVASIYVLINMIQFTLISLFNSLAFEYMNMGIPMNYGLARGTGSIAFAVISYFLGVSVNQFGAGILLAFFIISYCFLIIAAFTFKLNPSTKLSESNPTNDSPTANLFNDKQKTSETIHSEHPPVGITKEQTTDSPASILGFFLKYKKFSLLLIGVTLIFYSHSMINTYLINIVENVGGNSADMGLSLTIAAVLELPTMAAFIFLVKKIKCSTLLKVSAFFFFIKIGTTWLAPNVAIIYFSQIFQMFAFALFTPASVYYVNSVIDEQDKVKGQSMLGVAIWGIAGTVSGVTGGKILDTLGVSDMLLLGTIVSAIGFFILCFTTEDKKMKL